MKTVIYCLLLVVASARCFARQPLRITPLTGPFYIFTTWHPVDGQAFPSNGLFAVTDAGVVMLDVPWDTTQTVPLLDSIKSRFRKKVVMTISTHFHADRTAGLDILKRHGVRTYSSEQTYELCKKHKEQTAAFRFTKDTVFNVGGLRFETFYPGPGHTADNIVIWFSERKILYGGCFVKSTEAGSLGNLEDADVSAWAVSIDQLMKRYKNPAYVIPGHQSWRSVRSLKHTADLIKSATHK